MEKEEKNEKAAAAAAAAAAETEFMLQWGNRKRVRCVRVHPSNTNNLSRFGRKSFLTVKQPIFPPLTSKPLTRNSETATIRSENGKSSSGSPERHYSTRGSVAGMNDGGKNMVAGGARDQGVDERNNKNNNNNNNNIDNNDNGNKNNSKGVVCPKIYITLSSKEKEEDFMAMKGCKLPQRPKKRTKAIQRTLLFVSPGAWLTDMSLERYEVREKKSSKKRPRGLKAMGSIETDSE